MKKFKVENLCTFKVLHKPLTDPKYYYTNIEKTEEIIIPFRIKKIKDISLISIMVKRILPNSYIISIEPQNKRAKRLIKNAQTRIKLKKNTTKSVVGWSFNYTMPGMSSTSTNYYYSS
jgi:hypothetical protein